MRTVDITTLPMPVQRALKEFVVSNPSRFDNVSFEAMGTTWGLEDALDAYLNWEGVIGYTRLLMAIFNASKEA